MMITANGIEICAEAFGKQGDPAILLIGGAAASMDWWEDEFCERLAAGGRYVIRYDNRDTGQSTSYPSGKPLYGRPELVTDAIAVLDGFGIKRAHIVGVSMGGGIAQHVAVEHPERVLSLTLIATSPSGPGGAGKADLPPPLPRIAALFESPSPSPDWTDRAAVMQFFLTGERDFSGTIPVDEKRIRAIAGKAFDRTRDMEASQTNHWILSDGGSIRDRLNEIAVPTLVLHGTEDPLFPFAHGEALAAEIPGARLIPLPGMGHQMPPPQVWEKVIDAILQV